MLTYNRTDYLPSCPDLEPTWTADRQTIIDSATEFSESLNLFDISRSQYNFALNQTQPCISTTEGVQLLANRPEYQYITFDFSVACGETFISNYECALTIGTIFY